MSSDTKKAWALNNIEKCRLATGGSYSIIKKYEKNAKKLRLKMRSLQG